MNSTTNYLINVLGGSPEIREIISSLPVFRENSEQLIDLIINYGKVTNLKKGDTLIKEGEFDQWVHILLRGQLSVYIGEKKIDIVKESLVGERCILGEARKATLKAEVDDTATFAIDMALLDVLENEDDALSSENLVTLSELISIITDIIFKRLIKLFIKQKTAQELYLSSVKEHYSERYLEACSSNIFPEDETNDLIVYRYLREKLADQLEKYWVKESSRPDYNKLYCGLLASNQVKHLIAIIDACFEKFASHHQEFFAALDKIQIHAFEEVIENYKNVIHERFAEYSEQIDKDWNSILDIENSELNLCFNLNRYLQKQLGVDPAQATKLIMAIMEESLNFNSMLNKKIQQISENTSLQDVINDHFEEKEHLDLERQRMERIDHSLIKPYIQKISTGIQAEQPKAEEKKTQSAGEELDIEKLMAEHSEQPQKEETNASFSNDDLDALFNANKPQAEAEAAENKTISNNDLDALFNSSKSESDNETSENKTFSNDDLDALFK